VAAGRQGLCRHDGRRSEQLRPTRIETGVLRSAEGSARVQMGQTVVLCAATVEDRVPQWLRNSGRGWVTAEYGMLPRSSPTRIPREAAQGRQGGRTLEIQRLIGRSLRAVVDLSSFGERTVTLDCDVIEADGGTRTAAVNGASAALYDAFRGLVEGGLIPYHPMRDLVAAVSVGIVAGEPVLDLDYEEDSAAGVDMNVVMTGAGQFVEVQGTAESAPFTDKELQAMLRLGKRGIRKLLQLQRKTLGLKA
jgi:ribonuclease PH